MRKSSTAVRAAVPTTVLSPFEITPLMEGGSTGGGGAKENDGRVRRKRMVVKTVVAVCVFVISYQLLWTYWLAGMFVPDYEIDPVTGLKKHRRRPDRLYKLDKFTQKKVPTTPFDGVMEGFLTLISIDVARDGLIQAGNNAHGADYVGVKATFCHISWMLQQQNPAKVPMFRDLQQQSPLCSGTLLENVDFYQVTEQARAYDKKKHNFTATNPGAGHQVVPPTAVVFHETRCGSTLVSNMLAASLPKQVRSYSESPPPLQALLACETLEQQGKYCDPAAQRKLIQDVFYMMGRVTRPDRPQFVFYKIQSIGVRRIQLFTQAMPKVPWVFVYRDSVEIMMSHFKNLYGSGKNKEKRLDVDDSSRPVCLRNYGKPSQHPLLRQVVSSAGRNVTSLTKEEYCAAHLASLAQAAVTEYQSDIPPDNFHRTSWFLDYRELPHILWEQLLPRLHMGYVGGAIIERMQRVANIYSKDRAGAGQTLFHDDSASKRAKAPESVQRAAQLFLDPLYQTMKDISETQK